MALDVECVAVRGRGGGGDDDDGNGDVAGFVGGASPPERSAGPDDDASPGAPTTLDGSAIGSAGALTEAPTTSELDAAEREPATVTGGDT